MNDNLHIQRLEQIEQARKLFTESEWRLNFLRTQTGTPTTEPNDKELLQWFQQHQN